MIPHPGRATAAVLPVVAAGLVLQLLPWLMDPSLALRDDAAFHERAYHRFCVLRIESDAVTFRSHDRADARVQRRWSRVFAIASIVTPVMLGTCVRAVLSGRIRVTPAGDVTSDYFTPWLAAFPLAVGAFALALCAFLAATYLTVEAREPDLRRVFRARALAAAVASFALAWLCFALARNGAPVMHQPDQRWNQNDTAAREDPQKRSQHVGRQARAVP